MRVLLPAFPLLSDRPYGGVESYWRNLVPALLDEADGQASLALLSASLRPSSLAPLAALRGRGAVIHHWWMRGAWLESLGSKGGRLEWFAGKTDLIHAPEPAWDFPSAARLVVTCHDLLFVHYPQTLHPQWADRLLRGLELARSRATLWICDSEATRTDLIETCSVPRGRTCVVHLGVDEAFREAGRSAPREQTAADPYLLFLGSLEPKKNLPMLLRAYANAADRGLRSRLVIAGRESWQSEALRHAIAASGAGTERIDARGFVAQRELPGLVAGALALVLPSRLEGFGLPVVEAMAAGTPVLCSDRGSLPEVAGDAALLFDPDDEDGLAELMLQIEGDAELRSTLREQGLSRSKSFSWSRCARHTLAAYQRAMELPR